jgi:hypothetical protein
MQALEKHDVMTVEPGQRNSTSWIDDGEKYAVIGLHLRRNAEADRGAPRVPRGEATWNCVDCYAGQIETLFQTVDGRLIIDFHREPIEARPLAVANARAITVPDVHSDVVVIAARG